ncbi:MAG: hypothetical protein JF616_08675 [Fibrobacteres bacterium]|nr:hypothetical protein [Fibrobacterota bacterium]
MPGVPWVYRANVMALPDSGYLIGVEGGSGIWTSRFRPDGTPIGRVWAKTDKDFPNSIEFESRPGGGWFTFWVESEKSALGSDSETVHWQAFDAEGGEVGSERENKIKSVDVFSRMQTQTLGGGRLLIQIGEPYSPAVLMGITSGGEIDPDLSASDEPEAAGIVCDSVRSRCYGLVPTGIARLDANFHVQSIRSLPEGMEIFPTMRIDALGRLILIGRGDYRRPAWEQRALQVWTIAPF